MVARNGEVSILGLKDRVLESFAVPNGAILDVEEGQQVQPTQRLCHWDPHMIPILAEVGGRIRFDEIIEGETLRKERDVGGGEVTRLARIPSREAKVGHTLKGRRHLDHDLFHDVYKIENAWRGQSGR